MSKSLRLYTAGISLIGGVLVLWALVHPPTDWPGLLVLATLAAVAEWTNVELFPNSRSRVSVSSVIALAGMLLFGPLGGVLTHAVSGLTTAFTTAFQPTELDQTDRASLVRRTAFNTGMFSISVAAAGAVYTVLGGTVGHVALASNAFPLIAAAVTDHAVNIGLLMAAIVLQSRKPPLDIWRENFAWSAPIAITAAIAGSAALGLAYQLFHFLGLAVFLLPVLLIRYAYWLYVRTSKQMNALLASTQEELESTVSALVHSRETLADLVKAVTSGESQFVLSQSAQRISHIDDDLAMESRRLQGLQQAIAQVSK